MKNILLVTLFISILLGNILNNGRICYTPNRLIFSNGYNIYTPKNWKDTKREWEWYHHYSKQLHNVNTKIKKTCIYLYSDNGY